MFELGNNLREARQKRRIDLVIAEQDTKIRSKYLSALETEDFDILPGPVFVRGFLRTYSRYLGLDPQLFIDEYNSRFGRFEDVDDQSSPSLGRPGLAQQRVNRGQRAMRGLLVVSLIVVAGLTWLGLRGDERSADDRVDPPVTRSEATTPTPTPERQPGALGAAARAASQPSTPAAPRAGSSATTGERPAISER